MSKPKVIILTGAGVSAESGINTFRDAGGLWEGYDVMEVASPGGWQKNRPLVLDFYNQRRRQLNEVKPNDAHFALKALEKKYEVTIITQNVDDLHERAKSKNIIHLHGQLRKVRSTVYPDLVYDWDKDCVEGDRCERGAQLRPHIVWFGEAVPEIENAAELMPAADIIIIIGTSMQVYPAAGLVNMANYKARIYYIDPHPAEIHGALDIEVIAKTACQGVPPLVEQLLTEQT